MYREFSTNTNLLVFNKEKITRDMDGLIPVYASFGIRNLDLNFCEMMRPDSRLNRDESERYIETLKELKTQYDLNYVGSHAPYPIRGTEIDEWDEKIIRAIGYAEALGCEYIVVHPEGKSIEENIRRYEKFTKHAERIKIAIENMEGDDEISRAEEINKIVESNSEKLRALFDTGHAEIRKLNLKDEIIEYGKNLVGLHIHDNDGLRDQHLLPFMGKIDWKGVMDALDAISYPGYLTYEAMYVARSLSIKDQDEVVYDAFKAFDRLLSLLD